MRDLVCGKELPAEGTPYADGRGNEARYFCRPECLTEFTANRLYYLHKHRTRPSIWLAMSGGGFRAALFHYGCLKRLHEVGLLPHVSGISATSGGTYVAALLGVHSEGADFYADPPRLGLWRYDWPAFEQALLGLVHRGVLKEAGLLLSATILYAVGGLAALWHPQLGAFAAGVGLAVHLSLAVLLWQEGAHRHSDAERLYWKAQDGRDIGWTSWKTWRRFLGMLVMPAYLRWNSVDLRAFHGLSLASLMWPPRIYLCAYDLNTGKEMVFSQHVIAPLDRETANSLWHQPTRSYRWHGGDTGIALAVAASSAFPPYFRPVTIRGPEGVIGVFVDGGLADNLAMNVPRAFSLYVREEDTSPDLQPTNPFWNETKLVLMLDASMGVIPLAKRWWSRLRSLTRLVDVIGTPGVDSAISTLEFLRAGGITSWGLGLRSGFMPLGELVYPKIDSQVARIRTNLDGFSPIECAVLAYYGYLSVEQLIDEVPRLREMYPLSTAPLRGLSEMLPEGVGDVPADPDTLWAHLRYSHRRLLIARWLGRHFGV